MINRDGSASISKGVDNLKIS